MNQPPEPGKTEPRVKKQTGGPPAGRAQNPTRGARRPHWVWLPSNNFRTRNRCPVASRQNSKNQPFSGPDPPTAIFASSSLLKNTLSLPFPQASLTATYKQRCQTPRVLPTFPWSSTEVAWDTHTPPCPSRQAKGSQGGSRSAPQDGNRAHGNTAGSKQDALSRSGC